MSVPVVSIVGRPNVGKSTLFNRFIGRRKSLVEDIPGVTRDRIYSECEWENRKFVLIDTGGLDTASEEAMKQSIASQVKVAIDESDLIIVLCDGKDGLLPEDREVVNYLRMVSKPFILAVNKVDGPKQKLMASEFYELGEDMIHTISAAHGLEIADLLDDVVDSLPEEVPHEIKSEEEGIRITFLGRPNAGKSSMINRIIEDKRLLVDDVAGTTVDSIDIPFEMEDQKFVLVDTAGIRKKKSSAKSLEQLAIYRAVRAVEDSDIVVLMIDANRGIHDQDAKLASLINQKGKGIIILFNKWDLVKNTPREEAIYKEFESSLRFVPWAQTIRSSALTGKGIKRLFEEISNVFSRWDKRVSTGQLNNFLEQILVVHPPPYVGRRALRFYYITQPDTRPPLFIAHVNRPDKIPESYKRYLLNQLREEFDFKGTPIKLVFRASHEPKS